MKRIFTLLPFFLVVGLLLPACGISLEKRQHTGGYYVNVNPRKHALKDHRVTPEPQEATAETEAIRTESLQPEELVAEATLPKPLTDQEMETAETPAVTQDNQKDAAPSAKERVVRMVEKMPLIAKVVDRMGAKDQQTKSAGSASARSGDALSLFWIVILVLLILWAAVLLGSSGGVGWAINILLIVALVLLILWLLRIV